MAKRKDLTGQRFGRWVVLSLNEERSIKACYWNCICDCGTKRPVCSYSLTAGISKSCGCLQREQASKRQLKDITGQRFGRLLVIKRELNRGKKTAWLCRCDCGNETIVHGGDLRSGHTKSCGCLGREKAFERVWKDLTGMRFGKLVVIELFTTGTRNVSVWKCLCDCGNETYVISAKLNNGHTKSCGCYAIESSRERMSKDITNCRFGSLVAKYFTGETKSGGRVWHCECDCGGTRKVTVGKLTIGEVSRCTDCTHYINGIRVSSQQVKIANMVGGILNFKDGQYYIDIALVDERIAIEYDGWYWHQNRQEQDEKRIQNLIASGWRVFNIKSAMKVPSQELICSSMKLLETTNPVTLTLSDWGIR